MNGEKNGKGKEYEYNDNNKLLRFDGQYLNGKMWNGKLFDENGYINYIRDGKGILKEFNKDNILKGEGKLLNGEQNGKVRVFNDKGQLIFEGEYLDGMINGKVREYNDKGEIKFEGEYLYGYERKGKEYINGRLEYEGEYINGKKWNGKGYDENGNIIYELINGNGKVKEYYSYNDKLKFEGEYLNGKKNGKGKEYLNGKLIFEGQYLNGKRWNGKGKDYEFNEHLDIYLQIEAEYLNGEKRKIEQNYYWKNWSLLNLK